MNKRNSSLEKKSRNAKGISHEEVELRFQNSKNNNQ